MDIKEYENQTDTAGKQQKTSYGIHETVISNSGVGVEPRFAFHVQSIFVLQSILTPLTLKSGILY